MSNAATPNDLSYGLTPLTQTGANEYCITVTKHLAPSGRHALQVALNEIADQPGALPSTGQPVFWSNDSLVWFDPLANLYGTALVVDTRLDTEVANYTVTLYDESESILVTWSGENNFDRIYNEVDLSTISDGGPYTGNSITVEVEALTGPPKNKDQKKRLREVRSVAYSTDTFEFAYGWDENPNSASGRKRAEMYQGGVVDILFNPAAGNTYPATHLNAYRSMVFGMYYPDDQIVLRTDMVNSGIANFFFSGHGSQETFGATTRQYDNYAVFRYDEIEAMYHNRLGTDGTWAEHGKAFRLVILNSCYSAASDKFAIAFGFSPSLTTVDDFRSRGLQPGAFVGWTDSFHLPNTDTGWPPYFAQYQETLQTFTQAWMDERSLSYCLKLASNQKLRSGQPPLDFPMSKNYKVTGTSMLTRSGTFLR